MIVRLTVPTTADDHARATRFTAVSIARTADRRLLDWEAEIRRDS